VHAHLCTSSLVSKFITVTFITKITNIPNIIITSLVTKVTMFLSCYRDIKCVTSVSLCSNILSCCSQNTELRPEQAENLHDLFQSLVKGMEGRGCELVQHWSSDPGWIHWWRLLHDPNLSYQETCHMVCRLLKWQGTVLVQLYLWRQVPNHPNWNWFWT